MSLYLGNTNIAGTQVLYSTTGNNTDGAMTQNATTTQLNLKANDANVIHKTGNETVAGVKTFSGNNRIIVLQNSAVTYNTAPSSNTYTDMSFRDKNGYEMGVLEHVRFANNNTEVRLAVKGVDSIWAPSLIVGKTADGNVYASAPASDFKGSIVTTISKSKATNGYFKLGNGLIIQWGKTPNIGNSGTTCTLPTPFTTTNYSVTAITSSAFNENCIALTGKTTTNFTLVERGYDGGSHNVPNYFLAIGY